MTFERSSLLINSLNYFSKTLMIQRGSARSTAEQKKDCRSTLNKIVQINKLHKEFITMPVHSILLNFTFLSIGHTVVSHIISEN